MSKKWKIVTDTILFFCLCSLSLCINLGFAFGAAYPHTISIRGENALLGYEISHIAAYSKFKSEWRRIALQIDEVNARGDYVLSEGLPFTANSDDGFFDRNDELVFSGKDIGEAFSENEIPKDLRAAALILWKVKVLTSHGALGEILVTAQREIPSAMELKSPVVFDKEAQVLTTSHYRYRFHKERAALLGQVELTQPDGNWQEIFKDSRFLMALRLPWYLPNFTLNDSNFTSTIESWQSGPVRTIVAVGVKFKSFLSIFNLHMFSELVFYDNALQIPTVIEFKFDPSKHFKIGSGIFYAITLAEGLPWELETNLVDLPNDGPEGVLNLGKKAADFPFFYAKARIPKKAIFVKVIVDQDATKEIPPPFYVSKARFRDQGLRDYWHWLEKVTGDLGVFIDFSRVRQGSYEFGLDLLLLSEADESTLTDYKSVATEWSVLASR